MLPKTKNWLVFLLGLGSITEIRFIGSLGISELCCYALAPFIFSAHLELFKRLRFGTFFVLLALWAGSAVLADFVQTAGSGDLAVEQREHVAGAGKRPDVRLGLPRDPVRKSFRNPLDDLPQGGVCCLCWPRGCAVTRLRFVFFHAPVGYRLSPPKPTLFL